MICNGQVSTLAGIGVRGFSDGPATTKAMFSAPRGIAVHDGTVYVADHDNHRIRMIKHGQVSTIAGTGTQGFADGAAAQAIIQSPFDVAVDHHGDVYVADSGNRRIRLIRDGEVSTLAGDGARAFAGRILDLDFPIGVTVDQQGALYISEHRKNFIRKIYNRQVSKFGCGKGFVNGEVAQARFSSPYGVAVDHYGTLYVADCDNNCVRVISNGVVETLGDQTPSSSLFLTPAIKPVGAVPLPILDATEPSAHSKQLLALEKAIGVAADFTLHINETALMLNRSFISLRCPKLLNSSLRVQPVDRASIALFEKFLSTDRVLKNSSDLTLTELMGLSVR
jgi:hypothetical protein